MWTTVFIAVSAAALFHSSVPAACNVPYGYDSEQTEAGGEYSLDLPDNASHVPSEAPMYVQDAPLVAADAVSNSVAAERLRGVKSTVFGFLALLAALAVGAVLNKADHVGNKTDEEQGKGGTDYTTPVASASAALMVSGLIELLSSAVQKATANPKLQALRGLPQLLVAAVVFLVAAGRRMGEEEDEEARKELSPLGAHGLTRGRIFTGVLAVLGLLLVARTFVKGSPSPSRMMETPMPEDTVKEQLIDAETTAGGEETAVAKDQSSTELEAEGEETEDAATTEHKNEGSANPSSAAPRADFASESLSSAVNSRTEKVSPLGREEFQQYMNQLAGLLGTMPVESLSALSDTETSDEGEPDEGEGS